MSEIWTDVQIDIVDPDNDQVLDGLRFWVKPGEIVIKRRTLAGISINRLLVIEAQQVEM